ASAVPRSSQAPCTAWNSVTRPPASGCVSRSLLRYARRSSSSLAVADTPSTSYGDEASGLSGTHSMVRRTGSCSCRTVGSRGESSRRDRRASARESRGAACRGERRAHDRRVRAVALRRGSVGLHAGTADGRRTRRADPARRAHPRRQRAAPERGGRLPDAAADRAGLPRTQLDRLDAARHRTHPRTHRMSIVAISEFDEAGVATGSRLGDAATPVLRVDDLGPTRGDGVFETASLVHGNVQDRKSTRLNSSHVKSSYAVFRLKKKNIMTENYDVNCGIT